MLLAAAASWAVAGSASVGSASEYVLHVKAVIDGSSDLILVGDKVFWLHRTFQRPGQQLRVPGDGPWPTVINGAEWFPEWRGNVSTIYPLPFKLPPDLSAATVTVGKIQVRGDIEAGVRNKQVVVRLDDGKINGADWYEFELRIKLAGAGPGAQPAASASASAPLKDSASTTAPQPPAATTSKDFIAAQADAEAKGLAAQRLAAEAAKVNEAGQAFAQAQAARDKVWQEARALEAQLQQGEPAYQKAVREEADIRKMGWQSGDTLYFQPGPYAQFIAASNLRQQLEADRNRLMDALTQRRAELTQADGLLQVAQRNYADLRGRYEKAFADIYNTEYPKRVRELEALRDQKVAEYDAKTKARLKEDAVPGQYTWLESGREVDKFTFAPDHSVKSMTARDKPAGQWKLTDQGLQVTQGGAEWLFLAGPPNTLFGTCLGPDPKAKGRKAMLQKTPPAGGAPAASTAETTPGAGAESVLPAGAPATGQQGAR
jgi:hypothetical protein